MTASVMFSGPRFRSAARLAATSPSSYRRNVHALRSDHEFIAERTLDAVSSRAVARQQANGYGLFL
jgi:hypothetical protein